MRTLELDVTPAWPASAVPANPPSAVRCTVLLPAHDEAAIIGASIDSLLRQTRRADRILVVADNCTDATVAIALAHGVEVLETVGNTDAKAGGLNQALAKLLPDSAVEDVFLVMDADSTITPDFLEVALGRLESDPDLMAVGGLFSGEDGAGILGQLQRNEFTRYQRVIGRREGHLFVLTGTASVFRGFALTAVAQARESLIPGHRGGVYDTLAMSEDNEITRALKSLGATMTSPPQCRVTTEVMPTWRDLRKQRLRWQRGALENVGAYGFTRTTAIYWVQQLGIAYGAIALHSYLALMAIGVLSVNGLRWSPFWVAIGFVFLAERVVTAWGAGWRGRAVAVVIFCELFYSLYLQWAFVTALAHIVTGRGKGWNDVPRPAVATALLAVPLAASLGTQWNPISAETMESSWVEALAIFVGVNTLIFATLSVFQMLPPILKTLHDRRARRLATS
jgi:cellulose synthase/poly-beta-1,6-N-acetylglucosamine synthase-like glycosyltransferase